MPDTWPIVKLPAFFRLDTERIELVDSVVKLYIKPGETITFRQR